ncbi:PadR family transcriptional regulator, partial [Micrococcus flavus]
MSRTSALAHGELTDAALHVMLALTRPRHGYAVMQFLTERSDGRLTLGPASLYTTLKKLRDAGFIEELDGDDARR